MANKRIVDLDPFQGSLNDEDLLIMYDDTSLNNSDRTRKITVGDFKASTSQDLSTYATKEQLNGYATTESLESYATTDSISTLGEAQGLATTSWVQTQFGNQAIYFFTTAQLPPVSEAKTNVIYLVPAASSGTDNAKDEYIYLSGSSAFEKIGNTSGNVVNLNDGVATGSIQQEGSVVGTTAIYASALGSQTSALGAYSHSEGQKTLAGSIYDSDSAQWTKQSHAQGYMTTASNWQSHAEGGNTLASGSQSHSQGHATTASGWCSHAEGHQTLASGSYSHAQGEGTIANQTTETVIGKFNSIPGTSQAFIIGNGTGTATSNRSNAMTVDWSGNQTLAGSLTVGRDPTSNMEVATKQYVDNNSSNDNESFITEQDKNIFTVSYNSYDFYNHGYTQINQLQYSDYNYLVDYFYNIQKDDLCYLRIYGNMLDYLYKIKISEINNWGSNNKQITFVQTEQHPTVNWNSLFISVNFSTTPVLEQIKFYINNSLTSPLYLDFYSTKESIKPSGDILLYNNNMIEYATTQDNSTCSTNLSLTDIYSDSDYNSGYVPALSFDKPTIIQNIDCGDYASTAAAVNKQYVDDAISSIPGFLNNVENGSGSSAVQQVGTTASGNSSFSIGNGTIAQGLYQTVIGNYNIAQGSPTSGASSDYIFIIGNGANQTYRSNAFMVDRNGNTTASGKVTAGTTAVSSDKDLITRKYFNNNKGFSPSVSTNNTVTINQTTGSSYQNLQNINLTSSGLYLVTMNIYVDDEDVTSLNATIEVNDDDASSFDANTAAFSSGKVTISQYVHCASVSGIIHLSAASSVHLRLRNVTFGGGITSTTAHYNYKYVKIS